MNERTVSKTLRILFKLLNYGIDIILGVVAIQHGDRQQSRSQCGDGVNAEINSIMATRPTGLNQKFTLNCDFKFCMTACHDEPLSTKTRAIQTETQYRKSSE